MIGILIAITSLNVQAQLDKKSERSLRKASRLVKREKYYKAADRVRNVIRKYPVNNRLWDYYQEIYYRNYQHNYVDLLDYINQLRSTGDPQDQEHQMFMYVLETPKRDYLNAIYDAATYVPFNVRSAGLMRLNYVDPVIFERTKLSEESKEQLNKAIKAFDEKNYQDVIDYGLAAYKLDTNNYQALSKVGRAYYELEYYGDAAIQFRKAIALEPDWIEPRIYLADVLNRKGDQNGALVELKSCLLVYPDESSMVKINQLLTRNGHSGLHRHWILRLAPVAVTHNERGRHLFFEETLHFQYYTTALEAVASCYDEDGIKKEDCTEEVDRYLEVECFERMLTATENEDIPALDHARMMQEMGMLDAYLFIGLYNVDLYTQFTDYIEHNREEAKRYIDQVLIGR